MTKWRYLDETPSAQLEKSNTGNATAYLKKPRTTESIERLLTNAEKISYEQSTEWDSGNEPTESHTSPNRFLYLLHLGPSIHMDLKLRT